MTTPDVTPDLDMSELFYLQDSRNYVGNDVLWWAKDGHGYTTDLSKAHVFTKAEAISHHLDRETDIPWPKAYIDERTRPTVDVQYIDRDVALSRTGIIIRRTTPRRAAPVRCEGCGVFMKAEDQYDPCRKCGADNRP